MTKILPCKICGSMPVGIKMNFGVTIPNYNGDKPHSIDNWKMVYVCMNQNCGVEQMKNDAIEKWNKKQETGDDPTCTLA